MKVTVEQLLKLKRYEQPDESFWKTLNANIEEGTYGKLIRRESFLSKITRFVPVQASLSFSAAMALLLGFFFVGDTMQPSKSQEGALVVSAESVVPVLSEQGDTKVAKEGIVEYVAIYPESPLKDFPNVPARYALGQMAVVQPEGQHFRQVAANRTLNAIETDVVFSSGATMMACAEVVPSVGVY